MCKARDYVIRKKVEGTEKYLVWGEKKDLEEV